MPKIEGFQPIPNAVMIPFMEAQSAALAYGFGLNYEYGKRKIRSMSNDEYNSLTSEDITNMSNEHTHIILSKFQKQIPAVMPMQSDIFLQYTEIEKLKVKQNIELLQWIINYVATSGSSYLQDALAGLLGGNVNDNVNQPSGYEIWLQNCKEGSKFLKDDGTTVSCPNTSSTGNDTPPPPPPPPDDVEPWTGEKHNKVTLVKLKTWKKYDWKTEDNQNYAKWDYTPDITRGFTIQHYNFSRVRHINQLTQIVKFFNNLPKPPMSPNQNVLRVKTMKKMEDYQIFISTTYQGSFKIKLS